jgi:hypothetical protein
LVGYLVGTVGVFAQVLQSGNIQRYIAIFVIALAVLIYGWFLPPRFLPSTVLPSTVLPARVVHAHGAPALEVGSGDGLAPAAVLARTRGEGR